jgi:metal-responsive CopG/Arc/MetJ family transcriptional regulator
MIVRKIKVEGTDLADASVRASISFPRELYETLEAIARQKKVSLAWVVRDAAEQYVADKWPLFKGQV